jgi:hypothetical protein
MGVCRPKLFALLAIFALASAAFVTTVAGGSKSSASVTPAPLGKTKYIVFMADGILPVSQAVEPLSDAFLRDVMKETPEETAAYKARAIAFFEERFGLDFSSGDSAQGVTLVHIIASPKLNYRAYTVSGESVPATGWKVRDTAWYAVVGAGGTTLRGTWGGSVGKVVPEGASIPFGDYRIEVEAPDGSPGKPIDMHFQGNAPIPPLAPGTNPVFSCELFSPEFGHGEAFGVTDIRPRPDGQVHFRVRNVLTFP